MTKRHVHLTTIATLVILSAYLFLPSVVCGQAAKGDAQRETIRVREFKGLTARCLVKTPEYRTSVARGLKPLGDWAQIEVKYDTAPEWIDELTFQFYALAKDADGNYSLYKNTVRQIDVERGKGHSTAMFVRPSALRRYGQLVAVAVEILQGGKIIDEQSEKSSGDIPKDWWKNPQVTESKKVTAREGYLLDRAQSPFALINIDDYEVIK